MRYRFPEGITTSTTTSVIINVITTCVIITTLIRITIIITIIVTTLISITIIVTTLISTAIITIIWRPTIPRNSIFNIFCWKKIQRKIAELNTIPKMVNVSAIRDHQFRGIQFWTYVCWLCMSIFDNFQLAIANNQFHGNWPMEVSHDYAYW